MTEIGIRKVMGAQRTTIIKQLITESILVSLIAFPLAMDDAAYHYDTPGAVLRAGTAPPRASRRSRR